LENNESSQVSGPELRFLLESLEFGLVWCGCFGEVGGGGAEGGLNWKRLIIIIIELVKLLRRQCNKRRDKQCLAG